MEYSHIDTHFQNPNYLSMVKTMAYPLFLSVIHACGISFSTALSALWILAAFSMYCLIQKLFHNRIFSLISFLYILFHPVGYNVLAGLRIYRNTLIAPFVTMTFCEMFQVYFRFFQKKTKPLPLLLHTLLFSLLFLYTYFIKEDGIWLLACAAFFFLAAFIIQLIRWIRKHCTAKKFLLTVLCIFIPFVSLFSGTAVYRSVNKKYFGVAEIQTRTDGELGEFVSNIYKVYSDQQTCIYTAPAESIQAVYSISPTFQKYPELLDAILHSSLYDGNIQSNPIQGDFLTWVLRVALVETGLWADEREVSDLFQQINEETETAFANGSLKKNNKIQLLSSAVGRTSEEVLQLFPYVAESFIDVLTLKHYTADITGAGDTSNTEAAADAIERTDLNYLDDYSFTETSSYQTMVDVCDIIIWIYRIANSALLIFAVYAFILSLRQMIKEKKNRQKQNNTFFCSVMMLAISAAYAFAISWFAQFCMPDIATAYVVFNFYATAMIPLTAISQLFMIGMTIPASRPVPRISSSCRQ